MRPSVGNLHAVPHAGGVSVMACADRSHVHIVLFDEHDREALMQITFTPEQFDVVVTKVQAIFDGTSFGH